MVHDDFAVEPIRGLDRNLPEGERILWQGAPSTWALAKSAMSVHWVIGYFAVLAVWRGGAVTTADGLGAGIGASLWYLVAGSAAAGLILGAAWVFSSTTVYTITSSRVVMRIGAALTVSLNLPLKYIASADLGRSRDGVGSIHLSLTGDNRFSYLVLWPHVRPWRLRNPQPTLRCIADADKVAGILRRAAQDRLGAVVTELEIEEPDSTRPARGHGHAIPAE